MQYLGGFYTREILRLMVPAFVVFIGCWMFRIVWKWIPVRLRIFAGVTSLTLYHGIILYITLLTRQSGQTISVNLDMFRIIRNCVAFLTLFVRNIPKFLELRKLVYIGGMGLCANLIAEGVYNILLFVPLGFLMGLLIAELPYDRKWMWRFAAVWTVCFILLIELTQLLTKCGTFDFGDLVHNSVGMCTGLWMGRVDEHTMKLLHKTENLVHTRGRWIYSLRVLRGKVQRWYFRSRVACGSICTQKSNTVLATAFAGKKYGDNPKYIIEEIHKISPETQIFWVYGEGFSDSPPPFVHLISFGDTKRLVHEITRAAVIIDNNLSFKIPGRDDRLMIQTWHGGLGFKKIGMDVTGKKGRNSRLPKKQRIGKYDIYLSNSDHLTKIYRSAFNIDGPVWKCGYPIEDALLTNDNERQLFHERYHIPEDTKIILYAPTFRAEQRWQTKLHTEAVVESFQKRFGGSWVMMVHWHQSMRPEDRILSGAIDVTDTSSLQSVVKTADAFVSDYSSSIFQAVQRDIPCFVYADDYEEYTENCGLYYPLHEQPFPYAITEQELLSNIADYDKAVWNQRWKEYQIRMGHVVTGHSAQDVAKICVDFLNGKPKSEIMAEIPFEKN